VYWTRRILVLVVAFGLVFGISRLLGGGGSSPGAESASPVVSSPRATPTPAVTPSPSASPTKGAEGKKKRKPKLAVPSGPCADSDVLVTPRITDAHAGGDVKVVLELTTSEADACTWEVSPESVFLSITDEDGPVWSTQDCPAAVPVQAVVPRREHADKVKLFWPGKESDDQCSPSSPWVLQGVYTATAIARGSVNPVEVGFLLGDPVRPTRTATPTPTPTPTDAADDGATPTAEPKPSKTR
jgi:hypothetical protein